MQPYGVVFALVLVATPVAAAGLSFDERIAAQRAIEEVYWRHRIWPAQNPTPKPPLSAVLSDEAIRAKVEDYTKKSNALATLWQQPVTPDQLQAELDRMGRRSRDPERLRELYAALHNDPYVIAETLARPALADRQIRRLHAGDDRFVEPSGFDDWWAEEAARHPLDLRSDAERPPFVLIAPTGSGCVNDTWELQYYAAGPRSRHTAVWTGSEMIVWGGEVNTGGRYDPAIDEWTPTSIGSGVPEARSRHTAVWTGTQMIVWGGETQTARLNTGGRYDPASDSWSPTSTNAFPPFDVPSPRRSHTAVWTGTKMIVWGGSNNAAYLQTGAQYDPVADSWSPTSQGVGVPAARHLHSAVWTGTQMIVWGGQEAAANLGTGGRYVPATDTWMPTSTGANVPAARRLHTAVWTGSRMIVWGGNGNTSVLNTGAIYDPVPDTWRPISVGTNVTARSGHTAVWTGSSMIVWGGTDGSASLNKGAVYDAGGDVWTLTSTASGVPAARVDHTAVWTGSEMIVWGGLAGPSTTNTGGRYLPTSDAWTPTHVGVGVPTARFAHTAVWTGSEMIVWGGSLGTASTELSSGARYDPAIDAWLPTSTALPPTARGGHTAVWTGTRMIVWGGIGGGARLNTGGRYDPATNAWTATSIGPGLPTARSQHSAVWTGSEMIVWGGNGTIPNLNDGGRYNPASNSWIPTSTGAGVPSPRRMHTAVWSAPQMIVWGGEGVMPENSGGRYDTTSDSWTSTSIGAGVPTPGVSTTAVWTGDEMLVWGGGTTGGRYDPASDGWLPISGAGAPDDRSVHTAVWSGARMIVWGGIAGPSLNTGGAYDPEGDTWSTTSTDTGVPAPRSLHTAVWTGSQMLVWGGAPLTTELGLYCAVGCTIPSVMWRDVDGDGHGDAADAGVNWNCTVPAGWSADSTDCAPLDGTVHAAPAEADDLAFSDDTTLSFSSGGGGSGTLHDVARGRIFELPVGSGASETCAAAGVAGLTATDPDSPAPGDAFWYLVRGRNACGSGTYGFATSGAERLTSTCP